MNAASSLAQSGFESSQSAGTSRSSIIQDLVKEYLGTYRSALAQGNQADSIYGGDANSLGNELTGSLQSGMSDINSASTSVGNTLVSGAISSAGASANTVINSILNKEINEGTIPDEIDKRISAFATVLDSKLSLFRDNVSRNLSAYDSEFGGNMQLLAQLLSGHFDGTVKSRLQEKAHKQDFTRDGVRLMQAMQAGRLNAEQAVMGIKHDIEKTKIISYNDQYGLDIEYDTKSANWDMELFQQAGNVLSAVTGAVVQNAGKPSKVQSALAGGAAGASVGTAIYPGIGTAIGAYLGGTAGYLSAKE